ncbi:MAG: NDP-sugar synthase [Dehalococcoidia bacterium]|nr:NDP-sugar synthase [Dehalococcoidia bacterium]
MKAVVLVGGEGTRLRPLTYDLPKPMLPVLNRPFLEHTIASLGKGGVEEAILAAGYLPEAISSHFGNGAGQGVRLTYSVEDSPLGTAGAVKKAERHLDGAFAVFNGDLFADLDLRDMLAFHESRKAKATIAMTWVDNPCPYGCVETGVEGAVRRFIEKPRPEEVTTHWINAGIYILEPEVLEHVPPGTHHMFETGLFPFLIERGETVFGYPLRGYWLDMGTPEKYLGLNCALLQGRVKSALTGIMDEHAVLLGEGCSVHPSARVEGPVLMGRNCQVGRHAVIKGPAVFGAECYLGEGASVERSVLWQGVKVGAGAGVKECILGRGVLVRSGDQLTSRAVVSSRVRKGQTRSVSFLSESGD